MARSRVMESRALDNHYGMAALNLVFAASGELQADARFLLFHAMLLLLCLCRHDIYYAVARQWSIQGAQTTDRS
jgi:hypothetical protein